MTPVVTWTTLSDSPQPLFWMRKKIRSTYKVCLLVRRRVLNCVLSAKGVFEKVQWVWRERRSVEQSGSSSGVSFGICLIDPYQCINIKKWRLTFVCTIYRIYPLLLTLQNGRENVKTKPKMSTTKHSQLQIGRLVCFSPSMGDFPIFERRSYFLDLMKKGLSLAADFGILRVDHVLR